MVSALASSLVLRRSRLFTATDRECAAANGLDHLRVRLGCLWFESSGFEPWLGTLLCFSATPFTLTVPLSTQVYNWVPANLMLGVNPAMD